MAPARFTRRPLPADVHSRLRRRARGGLLRHGFMTVALLVLTVVLAIKGDAVLAAVAAAVTLVAGLATGVWAWILRSGDTIGAGLPPGGNPPG